MDCSTGKGRETKGVRIGIRKQKKKITTTKKHQIQEQ
jgi:hypothetical protein